MKKIITLLIVLVTLNGYSQMSEYGPSKSYRGIYNPIDWPMYSQIYEGVEYTGEYYIDKKGIKRYEIKHTIKKDRKLSSDNIKHYKQNVNEEEVKYYLHESLNEFRKDYNLNSVVENEYLSKKSQEYSEDLVNEFKHSNYKEGNYLECISSIGVLSLYTITKDENVNKIISECCFDSFVGSIGHMKVLLSEDESYEYGFGITITNSRIYVVVRSQKTP